MLLIDDELVFVVIPLRDMVNWWWIVIRFDYNQILCTHCGKMRFK